MAQKRFKPSPQSMTSAERTVALLRYLRKATEVIEAHILATGETPPWVMERIHRAATELGMAVTYTVKKSASAQTEAPPLAEATSNPRKP